MAIITYPTIKFYNPDLLLDVERTYFTAELTTVGTGLAVENITGIGAGDYLLIGEFGQEKSEIVRVDSVASPSTVTLSAATVYTHERGTPIYRIDFNQVEFSRSTTLTGEKSVLSTVSINANDLYTVYRDTTNTTGYGWSRAKNSADSTYTNYSESYPYAGYSSQSLKNIFDSSLAAVGLKDNEGQPVFKGSISREDAVRAVNDCQEELAGLKKRWSYLTDFNASISEIATGQDTYALPTNIAFENGNLAVLAVRIGSQKDMTYIDKAMLNKRRWNVAKTALTSSVTVASGTWTLDDTSDLDDSGSFDIIDDDGEGFDTVDYTANDRANNQLTVTTSTIAESHSAGAIIWQGASYGKPTHYTIFEDNIVLDLPPGAAWEQYNLLADLYIRPTVTNDLADEAQFPAYVIKPYVAHILAQILDNGPSNRSQAFYTQYQEQKAVLLSKEQSGQFVNLRPIRLVDATVNQSRQYVVKSEDTNT